MGYDFNADEIFVMAQELERNGGAFYRAAAAAAVKPEHKQFLLELSRMEEEHERTFAMLRQRLGDAEAGGTVFDPASEAVVYLRSFMQTRVFFEKQIDTSSMAEVLKFAIEAERDSVAFYTGLRDLVPDRLGKSHVDEIIREEMRHLRMLAQELLATMPKQA